MIDFKRFKIFFRSVYMPVIVFALSLAVFIQIVHAEEPYDFITCFSGEAIIVYASKELIVLGWELKGITLDNLDTKIFDNNTFHCTGITKIVGGKRTENYYCKFMNPEGDIAIGEASRTGTDGIWKFLGGAGKWAGITGGGKNTVFKRGKPIKEGTFQGCGSAIGTFELPK